MDRTPGAWGRHHRSHRSPYRWILYTPSGHGAVVSRKVEYDAGVYAALQETDPTITGGLASSQGEKGWTVQESMKGHKILMRRRFDSLEKLQTVPALLAGDSGDASDSFVQATGVTTQAIDSDTIEYVYTATVVIPAQDTYIVY